MHNLIQNASSYSILPIKRNCIQNRRTKSQEEVKISKIDILEGDLQKHTVHCDDGNTNERDRMTEFEKSHGYKIEFGKCITNPNLYYLDNIIYEKDSSSMPKHDLRYPYSTDVFKSRHNPLKTDKDLEDVIIEWLDTITRNQNFLKRVDEQSFNGVVKELKALIFNGIIKKSCALKCDILSFIEGLTCEAPETIEKRIELGMRVDELLKIIKSSPLESAWKSNQLSTLKQDNINMNLEKIVRRALNDISKKLYIMITFRSFLEMENEIIDILKESMDKIRIGQVWKVKSDIIQIINYLKLDEDKAFEFSNSLIKNVKQFINGTSKYRAQYVVLQNTVANNRNDTMNSITGITEEDIQANLELYTRQLTEQIDEWLTSFQDKKDDGFRQAVQDLANDIVDRHKYLELNPGSKGTDADELEHLKYQIFKWINKLVGEDNMDTIAHAAEMMKRIQDIPVPMLTLPHRGVNTSLPLCQTTQVQDTLKDNLSSSKRNTLSNVESVNYNVTDRKSSIKPGSRSISITGGQRQSKLEDTMRSRQLSTANNSSKANSNNVRVKNGNQMPADRQSLIDRTNETLFGRFNEPPLFSSTRNTSNLSSLRATGSGRDAIGTSPGTSRRMSPSRISTGDLGVPCCSDKNNLSTTIKQLNEDYDIYLKDWIKQIPIPASDPEDQELADKARMGIYNGIWKAITKLKLDPNTFHNAFYYQDVFDDNIEELLALLPQTPELLNVKHKLKAQLIEKTTDTNELILKTAESTSYKQQLMDNVSNYLPKTGEDEYNVDKMYEDLQKLNMAEDFILYINYKEDDRVRANVYRKKLSKAIEELVNNVKRTHGKELKDIDAALYIDEIMSALYKVPLPNNDIIHEEADEILLGLEVEHWFSDLPLTPIEDYLEILTRRRQRNVLVKKIHDIEKQTQDCSTQRLLKPEISKFLTKLPFKNTDNINIDFLTDELLNRLKNRPRKLTKTSITFQEPNGYDEFSRQMAVCSSFTDAPNMEEQSYMIVQGERVDESYPYGGQHVQMRPEPQTQSSQQWYSMEATSAPFEIDQGYPYNPTGGFQEEYPNAQNRRQYMSPHIMPGLANRRNSARSCLSGQVEYDSQLAGSYRPAPGLTPELARAQTPGFQAATPDYQRRNMSFPTSSIQRREYESQRTGSFRNSQGTPAISDPGYSTGVPYNTRYPQPRQSDFHKSNRQSIYNKSIVTPTPNSRIPSDEHQTPNIPIGTQRRPTRIAKRRIEVESTEDEDGRDEVGRNEIRCLCLERLNKCRRKRPVCFSHEDLDEDYPWCIAMRYPPAYFF